MLLVLLIFCMYKIPWEVAVYFTSFTSCYSWIFIFNAFGQRAKNIHGSAGEKINHLCLSLFTGIAQ